VGRAALAFLLLVAVVAGSAVSPAAQTALPAGVLAATLDNGLRVLLLEDRRSPIVTFQTWYRVGSRNETRGHTGLAHFLEHLMFKGTPTYGPRQFARLVEQNGGQDNAFTSQDVTSYYVNIVSDKIDLVIDLEADRMQNLLLDPKDIDSERQVVIEERRTRTEDDPSGVLWEEVNALAFRAHPYGQPVIGWMQDLDQITPAALRAFYTTYYVPNNALVVAVGDFSAPALLEKIRQRFGKIARRPDPPAVTAVEPPQNGERRVVIRKAEARLPVVYMAYPVPNQKSDDAPALEMLSTILSGGRASRLYRSLIYDRQIALDAGGDYSWFAFDPSMFWFWATAMPGQTPETLEKELSAEMAKLEREPVSDLELRRARNQIEAAFVFQEDSVHRRAALLARFELSGGHALKDQYLQRIRAVTAADVQRVARTYFLDKKKNVGVLIPQP
jgi:zinc protease